MSENTEARLKEGYTPPEIEVVEIKTERGFANSTTDWEEGEEWGY